MFFVLLIGRPPRSTHCISSAASDVYKRQYQRRVHGNWFKQSIRVGERIQCANCKEEFVSVPCEKCKDQLYLESQYDPGEWVKCPECKSEFYILMCLQCQKIIFKKHTEEENPNEIVQCKSCLSKIAFEDLILAMEK
eukprot:TRINITY_DN9103_c0_g1_i2.p2 TRINITY_DN9103_c0_g1~~TRINITY_DN9103_c0_g1_i2.p2  ORF type:complete len:137 (+),score=31.46 TRINITY_DN9103_c0_g1_i2:30-440(+)